MRSRDVSRRLTLDDAVQIWQRRQAGEAQHVLAAAFGVNPGRIAEVLSGRRFPDARAIALSHHSTELTKEHIGNILQSGLPFDAGNDDQMN